MKSVLWSIVTLVVGAILVLWVLRFIIGTAVSVLGAIMPLLILGGVIYVIYKVSSSKSIGPGKKRILP